MIWAAEAKSSVGLFTAARGINALSTSRCNLQGEGECGRGTGYSNMLLMLVVGCQRTHTETFMCPTQGKTDLMEC